MPDATVTSYVSVGGISAQSTLTRTASGQVSHEITLPVGKAATLTTRTDDDDGVITLPTGHGLVTGTFDLFWTGGCRYGVEATILVNACTITGGAGDVLPADESAVIITPVVVIDTDFDGDLVELVVCHCTTRAHVAFKSVAPAVLAAVAMLAQEAWVWASGTSVNPLAGGLVDTIAVSNGDAATPGTLKVGVLYNSVTP